MPAIVNKEPEEWADYIANQISRKKYTHNYACSTNGYSKKVREIKSVSCEWYFAYEYYKFRTLFFFFFSSVSLVPFAVVKLVFSLSSCNTILFYGPWMKLDLHDAKQMRKNYAPRCFFFALAMVIFEFNTAFWNRQRQVCYISMHIEWK